MRVFVAGASGVLGRELVALLVAEGHDVSGTTRRSERARDLTSMGARAVVVDAFDRTALVEAVTAFRPDVVVHQLTDLGSIRRGGPFPEEVVRANARLRDEGTRNLVDAALAAGARRLVAQSIAWIYADGGEPHVEDDPLIADDPSASMTVRGIHALERRVLGERRLEGVVLRYGRFYGPGTWTLGPAEPPTVAVAAAARATVLAVTHGAPGVYNIVDDDGPASNGRARHELGWSPG